MEPQVLNGRRVSAWWPLALAALAAALAVPALRHLREQPPPAPPPASLAFAPPPGTELGSGDDGLDAAIAADQSQIVFVATTNGVAQLWRQQLASGTVDRLPGTEHAQLPAWKHTGNVVAFFADNRLKQIALDDGTVRDLAAAASPRGCAWLPDGSLLFAPDARGPIRRLAGGEVTAVTTLGPGDRAHVFPAYAGPDRFTYVAVRDDGRRTVRLVTEEATRDLTDTSGHAQIAGGYAVHARDGVLVAQRFDDEAGELTGRSVALSPAVGVSPAGHGMFAASDRLLVFADARPRQRALTWYDLASQATSLASDSGDLWQVRLAADDRRAAVTVLDPLLRTLDVMIMSTSGATDSQPLTRASAADSDPVWSPDGAQVLYRSAQSGLPRLLTRRVGVVGAPDEPFAGAQPGELATDWLRARGGSDVLLQTAGGAAGTDLFVLDVARNSRTAIANGGFNETDGRWSADGSWVAYVSDESGEPDVYATEPGTGRRVRVSFDGGTRPRWSRDGRAIFFLRGAQIMRAERTEDGRRFSAAQPVVDVPDLRDFDAAHLSDRLLLLAAAPRSRLPVVSAVVAWTSRAGGS